MNNLYNKIYEAVNSGIQKALIISDDQSGDSSVKFHNKKISTEFIPYEYRMVDMGTDVLWCEYNLGAYPGNKAKDWYGDYYAWGETEPKTEYSKDTYNNMAEDAIIQKLGNPFRLPTKQDYQELINSTTHKWIINYKNIQGLNGMLFISKHNGNTLFFPAAGYYSGYNHYNDNEAGRIWTSSINSYYPYGAFYLYFDSTVVNIYDFDYCTGLSIRGVMNSRLKIIN